MWILATVVTLVAVYFVWMSWLLSTAGPGGEPPRHGVHIYRETLASRGRRKK